MKLDRIATPLDALCRDLSSLLSASGEGPTERTGAEVARLLREYAAENECWRAFAHFEEERYARNLVWRCGDFELLLLCWGAGHESPVHDHSGQQCWMAVLDGELEEVHYEMPAESAAPRTLTESRVRRFPKGGVAYIHDEIALHLIRPAGGAPGVSLHLYAGAIDSCKIYDPETGEASRLEVGYDSVRGASCAHQSAEEIRADWAGA